MLNGGVLIIHRGFVLERIRGLILELQEGRCLQQMVHFGMQRPPKQSQVYVPRLGMHTEAISVPSLKLQAVRQCPLRGL